MLADSMLQLPVSGYESAVNVSCLTSSYFNGYSEAMFGYIYIYIYLGIHCIFVRLDPRLAVELSLPGNITYGFGPYCNRGVSQISTLD